MEQSEKQFEFLIPEFLEAINDIGRLGFEKHKADSFHARRLAGKRRGLAERNQTAVIAEHVRGHVSDYENGVSHDKFNSLVHQLAAAAFNTMMEAYYAGLVSDDAVSEKEMTGVERIAAERQRQIDTEGWTPRHDDEHESGELAGAARCYAKAAQLQACSLPANRRPEYTWPWDEEWWKPSDDPVRNLEKAGALIAAEIDRLQRKK